MSSLEAGSVGHIIICLQCPHAILCKKKIAYIRPEFSTCSFQHNSIWTELSPSLYLGLFRVKVLGKWVLGKTLGEVGRRNQNGWGGIKFLMEGEGSLRNRKFSWGGVDVFFPRPPSPLPTVLNGIALKYYSFLVRMSICGQYAPIPPAVFSC